MASVDEVDFAFIAGGAAAARLDVDGGESPRVAGGMRTLLDGHRLGEVDGHRVHERMRPHPGLARGAVRVEADLAAGARRAEAAHVDASALGAAVAADGRIARDRDARHLAERRLDILGVQEGELFASDNDALRAVPRDRLRLRDGARGDDDGRQRGDGVRLRRGGREKRGARKGGENRAKRGAFEAVSTRAARQRDFDDDFFRSAHFCRDAFLGANYTIFAKTGIAESAER